MPNRFFIVIRICAACLLVLTGIAGTAYASAEPVPEMDPTLSGAAVAVLVGGYLIAVSKFRRR